MLRLYLQITIKQQGGTSVNLSFGPHSTPWLLFLLMHYARFLLLLSLSVREEKVNYTRQLHYIFLRVPQTNQNSNVRTVNGQICCWTYLYQCLRFYFIILEDWQTVVSCFFLAWKKNLSILTSLCISQSSFELFFMQPGFDGVMSLKKKVSLPLLTGVGSIMRHLHR